jgi:hypothetical protein
LGEPQAGLGRIVAVKIELLYVDGCPNVTPTLERLKGILGESGVSNPITLTEVDDFEAAQAFRFLGSPTVRIDGLDIEPTARSRKDYGLMCRTYYGNGGIPSEALIRSAIAESRATR